MKTIYYSKHVVLTDSIQNAYITVEDGKIVAVSAEKPNGTLRIQDYENQIIYPGIVDIHSHGYRSWSAKTLIKEEILGLSNILPSIGVTATCPTVTGWKEHEFDVLHTIASAMEECNGARMLGIHMEGPFYNPNKHNATPLSEVQKPSVAKVKAYIEASDHKLVYMTLAPEIKHAHEVMDVLRENDICIGCGHTQATYQDFVEAKKHGMGSSIHTGNAMTQISQREVGLLGGALLDSDIYNEIICDFFHLSKEMLEIMFGIKRDYSKFIMISDSDVMSGYPPGKYQSFGKNITINEHGHMYLDDGTIYGSSKYVLYGIQNLVKSLNLPLYEVAKMSSLNPATYLKVDHQIGSIEVGKEADFLILDQNLDLLYTYIHGQCRYAYDKKENLENPNFKGCQRVS